MNENPYYTLKITITAGQPRVTCEIKSDDPINPQSPQKSIGAITLSPPKEGSSDYIWYFDKGTDDKYAGTITFQDPKYLQSPLAFGSNPSAKGALTGGEYTVDYSPLPDSETKTRLMGDPPAFEVRIP